MQDFTSSICINVVAVAIILCPYPLRSLCTAIFTLFHLLHPMPASINYYSLIHHKSCEGRSRVRNPPEFIKQLLNNSLVSVSDSRVLNPRPLAPAASLSSSQFRDLCTFSDETGESSGHFKTVRSPEMLRFNHCLSLETQCRHIAGKYL